MTHTKRSLLSLLTLVAFLGYLVIFWNTRQIASLDTSTFQATWWHYLATHDISGIATLNFQHFTYSGNYTTIWYALILIFIHTGFYSHFGLALSIKVASLIGSLASGILIDVITSQLRPDLRHLSSLFAVLTLYLPAFLGDLLKTNLPDSIYLALALASFLAFIKKYWFLAAFLLGLALSFKLMAIFLLPTYLYFYSRDFKKVKLTQKLAPLAGFLAILFASLPNVFAGGKLLDGIVTPLLGRSSSSMQWLSDSLWALSPINPNAFRLFSFVLLALVLVFTAFLIRPITDNAFLWTFLPVLSTLLSTYLLPAQHGNYFALASIFALLTLLARPKKTYIFLAVLLNLLLASLYANQFANPFAFIWNDSRLISLIFLFILILCYSLMFKERLAHEKAH
ncbi:MAG: hypothetical protein LBI43_01665 [Streptococcaceae bacterium]|jgi:Gpi18-like mannosyltransferase|nr:hypothetical protein [Streptococcaceae bacterium]